MNAPEPTSSAEGVPDGGSGDGGPMGTPAPLPDEIPPAAGQEANEVVSGGGVVRPDDEEADDEARPSAR
jgi:hypothetical protein